MTDRFTGPVLATTIDKDKLKAAIYEALRAGELAEARELSDRALREHPSFTMSLIALLCRLRQRDLDAAAAIIRTLKPAQWDTVFERVEVADHPFLWTQLSERFASFAAANLAEAPLAALLGRWAQQGGPVLSWAVAAMLPLARQKPVAALPLILAGTLAGLAKGDDGQPEALLKDVADAVRAGWPALVAAGAALPRATLALLPRRQVGGVVADRLAPLLGEALTTSLPPGPPWPLLANVAAAATRLVGRDVEAAYIAAHTDATPDAIPLLTALGAAAIADPALPRGPSFAARRLLAQDGVWLPLLLGLSATPEEALPEDEIFRLRHNPALLRLRPLLRAALESAKGRNDALKILLIMEREGDRLAVRDALAARPDLLEDEAGLLLSLRMAAPSIEWANALPPFALYAGRLHSPGAVRQAMRLLLAELDEPAARALVAGLQGVTPGERRALELECLRTAGRLTEWNALAAASGREQEMSPELRREVQLWQDERQVASPEPAVPRHAGTDADALRAMVRSLIVERRFAEAAECAATLNTRSGSVGSGNAADPYLHILALCHAERFVAALGLVTEARARFPADPRLAVKQAQIAEALGEFDLALQAWQVLGTLDPVSPQAQAGTARALLRLGRDTPLLALLDCMATDTPDRIWVHNMRALHLAEQGDTAAAQAAYEAGAAVARRFLAEVDRRAVADPHQAYVAGRWLRHPQPEQARSLALFRQAFAARIADPARRLVIVGNSPLLLAASAGAAIDEHHTVLRLNDFLTKGYEADAGRRTDLWYSSGNRHARKHDMRDFDLAVIGTSPAHFMPEVAELGRLRLGLDLDPSRACLLPPAYAALSVGTGYPKPTSGLRMILLANYMREAEFTITGFDFFTEHKLHYFDGHPGAHLPGETHVGWFEKALVTNVLIPFGRVRPLVSKPSEPQAER